MTPSIRKFHSAMHSFTSQHGLKPDIVMLGVENVEELKNDVSLFAEYYATVTVDGLSVAGLKVVEVKEMRMFAVAFVGDREMMP